MKIININKLIWGGVLRREADGRGGGGCTLMAQLPKTSQGGASLSSKVQPPYMKTVQPYTVSTSSLTMEVEAVTNALRWIASRSDSRTTHAIILTY